MTRAIARRLTRLESETPVGDRRLWLVEIPDGMDSDEGLRALDLDTSGTDIIVQMIDLGDFTEPRVASVESLAMNVSNMII